MSHINEDESLTVGGDCSATSTDFRKFPQNPDFKPLRLSSEASIAPKPASFYFLQTSLLRNLPHHPPSHDTCPFLTNLQGAIELSVLEGFGCSRVETFQTNT